MKSIAIFGPHDRFNYGDLLFSIMLQHAMEKSRSHHYNFHNFSLVDADFSGKGAFKTSNYKTLLKQIESGKIDALIVAGGESLRADWNGLYSFISPFYFRIFRHPRLPKYFKKDVFIRKFLGGRSDNPFLINKSDFNNDFRIIYNSVGGGHNMAKNKLVRLKDADYISFRESASVRYVQEHIPEKKIHLVPDCAIIMSDIYLKKDFLIHPNVRDSVNDLLRSGKYIFFQLSKYKNEGKISEAIKQLKSLSEKHKLKIVLCPIGTAKGHEDQEPLQKIHEELEMRSFLVNEPTMEEIMSLIAFSKLYIGNSLHCVITAMSYNVPYLGLNPKQRKIVFYLESWAIPELQQMPKVDEFMAFADQILQSPELNSKIETATTQQKLDYYQSVERITNILG